MAFFTEKFQPSGQNYTGLVSWVFQRIHVSLSTISRGTIWACATNIHSLSGLPHLIALKYSINTPVVIGNLFSFFLIVLHSFF
jgi:hypothetical protein